MKKATLYVVLNNINNSMTFNNSKNKLYSYNAYENYEQKNESCKSEFKY